MSGSETDRAKKLAEIKKLITDAKSAWTTGSSTLMALDKDIWHNIKADANVKKTKWFQSSSNIGPKITKAQAASTAFAGRMNLSNFKSAEKTAQELAKECKEFWGKHKDAQQDVKVKNALNIYEAAANDALKALKKIEGSIAILDKLDAQKAVADTAKALNL